LLVATTVSIAIGPGIAETALKRTVLGTIVASGTLEVASEPGVWKPGVQGAPILENTELRTGPGKVTMVALGNKGIIGVHPNSHVRIGAVAVGGLPISLSGPGEVIIRLPSSTDLTFLTEAAIIAAPANAPAPDDNAAIQGVITQGETETTVSLVKGNLRVRNRNAREFISVHGGEEVTVTGSGSTPRLTVMAQAQKKRTRRRLFSLKSISRRTGLIIAGSTVTAVGAGLGIAAGAGAFDDDDDDDDDDEGAPPGSPFTP
jgi:hypothetical protein